LESVGLFEMKYFMRNIMVIKNSIRIFSALFVFVFLASCGTETDSGLQTALDSGHVTTDINEADGFTPPQGSLTINDGVVATNQTAVTLKLTASDAVGVTAYYVSSQSANPTISDSNWNSVTSTTLFSKQVSETITAVEKSHYLYAWFRDSVGGTSTQTSASIIYDSTAPGTTSVSINDEDASTTNTVVSLTISASDSVGVTSYYTSETNSDPTTTDSGWNSVTSSTSYSATVDFTLTSATAAGNHSRTVYVWFKDVAGNVSVSASDEITLVVTDTTAPTNPSISINSGASLATSSSVTLSLSATDDLGVSAYFLSSSSSAPSSTDSGWTSITATASYSASVSYNLTEGKGTNTVYVWFKDTAGNVSLSASDSITYESIPNIYCGLKDSSTGGTSALSATKLTSGSTRTTTLSSGSNNYYFFFGASSSSTYTIAWSGNALWYTVYKGVGNYHNSSSADDDSTTISSYSGDVIIKFDPGSGGGDSVTFSITGGSIVDYHADKNFYCQSALSLSTNALSATSISTERVYQATLSSASSNYYAKFSASSSSTYKIVWSGNALWYTVYKGVGNYHNSSSADDDSTTISNYSGDVIIKFDPGSGGGDIVDFMVHEE
jgi:hypothetical protein